MTMNKRKKKRSGYSHEAHGGSGVTVDSVVSLGISKS